MQEILSEEFQMEELRTAWTPFIISSALGGKLPIETFMPSVPQKDSSQKAMEMSARAMSEGLMRLKHGN
jgi:hypothetical protein